MSRLKKTLGGLFVAIAAGLALAVPSSSQAPPLEDCQGTDALCQMTGGCSGTDDGGFSCWWDFYYFPEE